MSAPIHPLRSPGLIALGVVYLGCVVGLTLYSLRDPATAPAPALLLTLGITIVAAEQWHLNRPHHQTSSPISTAACLACVAMVYPVHPDSSAFTGTALVVSVWIALALGTLLRLAVDGLKRVPLLRVRAILPDVAVRAFSAALIVAALYFVPLANHGTLDQFRTNVDVITTIAITAAVIIGALTITTVLRLLAHLRQGPLSENDLADAAVLHLAIAATSTLACSSAHVLGPIGIPMALLPLALVHLVHRRQHHIRRAKDEAIRALARTGELTGHLPHGHTHNVAALSVALGTALGLSDDELVTIEHAALLHDLAQLRLADPLPGGVTTTLTSADQHYLAYHTAIAIRDSGFPNELHSTLAHLTTAWHNPHPELPAPRGAHIVRVAAVVDDILRHHAGPDKAALTAAFEELYRGVGNTYDPRVVDALTDVALTSPYLVSRHRLAAQSTPVASEVTTTAAEPTAHHV